jgi:hypothetical protein
MPKRVLDFDALWASDKIAACAEWAQAEYAWIYGLADANGSFELTNLRVLWCKVAAVRKKLPFTRFEQVISEFHSKGLLFIWSHDRKTYATGPAVTNLDASRGYLVELRDMVRSTLHLFQSMAFKSIRQTLASTGTPKTSQHDTIASSVWVWVWV